MNSKAPRFMPVPGATTTIDPPSLLAIPVKNEMPVRVELSWRRQN